MSAWQQPRVEMFHGGALKEHGGLTSTFFGENPDTFSDHLVALSLQITLSGTQILADIIAQPIYLSGPNLYP